MVARWLFTGPSQNSLPPNSSFSYIPFRNGAFGKQIYMVIKYLANEKRNQCSCVSREACGLKV